MKFLKYLFIFLAISSYSYAAGDIGDYIKISSNKKTDVNDTISQITKSTQDEIMARLEKEIQKLQKNIDENVGNITKKFDSEIQKATDRINNNIIGKGEKLIDDAQKQYDGLVKTKNKVISSIESIINNLPTYLLIIKIVIGILILCIFLLVFFIWKAYKKVKTLSSSILSSTSGEALININKRLDAIENKIEKLTSKLK